MTWRMLAIALSGAAALVAGCGSGSGTGSSNGGAPKPKADGPNVVLISIDTLRPDHLGCYGYPRDTSPNIDRLAAEGALFRKAISSTSWTLPAHAALFTGLADTVHGAYDSDRRLADDRTTLAERFGALGYETAGFFTGPYLHPVFGMAQGFDTYVDCTSYEGLSLATAASTGTVEDAKIENASHRDITNPRLTERVTTWLRNNTEDPFFLFVHMWDVHFDYIPPPPYDTMFDPDYTGTVTGEDFYFNEDIHPGMARRDLEHVIALYDGEIAWTDHHLGMILDLLDELNLSDDTIVALVSDHGTEFFEHGGKVHRRTLFDEVIRIPFIVRHPGHVEPGRTILDQVSIIDVAPTLLELAGAPVPDDVMGRSVAPLLAGRAMPEEMAIAELFTLGREWRAFRHNDRKMHSVETSDEVLLYDLTQDPGERRPQTVVASTLEWIQALVRDRIEGRAWLTEHRDRVGPGDASPALPEKLRKQLESLGYLGGAEEEEPDDE